MDYIALNHQARNYGIHYNSSGQIGGINYYTPENKSVKVQKRFGKTKVIVEVEDKQESQEPIATTDSITQDESLEEKLFAPKTTQAAEDKNLISQNIGSTAPEFNLEKQIQRDAAAEKTLKAIDQNTSSELLSRLEEVVESISKNPALSQFNQDYIIHIQGKEVNFANAGVRKVALRMQDKVWLAKAQNYFITAREDGIRIGSAEDFTSMEILEALWSTADHVGIDPRRFIVQLYNESRFNPYAHGQAGERGIGQFKKSTAEAYHYDWEAMTDGIDGFAYQALAAADFVKKVGEIAYNGSGEQAEKYQQKITHRLDKIADSDSDCVMNNTAYCSS